MRKEDSLRGCRVSENRRAPARRSRATRDKVKVRIRVRMRYLGLTINSETLCSQRFCFQVVRTCESFNNAPNTLCGTAKLARHIPAFLKANLYARFQPGSQSVQEEKRLRRPYASRWQKDGRHQATEESPARPYRWNRSRLLKGYTEGYQ